MHSGLPAQPVVFLGVAAEFLGTVITSTLASKASATTSIVISSVSYLIVSTPTATFGEVKRIPVIDSHIIKTLWDPKLNQLFVGCGNGVIKCYYDERRSFRGAQLCVVKTYRKKKHAEIVGVSQIITPHALPMFRQEKSRSSRKKVEKERLDPVKSRRPDLPITSGQGGRIASSGGTLSSYVIRNLGLMRQHVSTLALKTCKRYTSKNRKMFNFAKWRAMTWPFSDNVLMLNFLWTIGE
ncbi:hypothetical protein GQX74_014146 [Glossina fuscipes]|nr:hypothetical protein GQX74_014146 [Glossina fuscipes]